MKKNIIALFILLIFTSCGTQDDINSEEINKTQQETISVTSSIIPISSIINAIG
jgi:hypothetical protein